MTEILTIVAFGKSIHTYITYTEDSLFRFAPNLQVASKELPWCTAVCRNYDVHHALWCSQQLRSPALCGGIHVRGVPDPSAGGGAWACGLWWAQRPSRGAGQSLWRHLMTHCNGKKGCCWMNRCRSHIFIVSSFECILLRHYKRENLILLFVGVWGRTCLGTTFTWRPGVTVTRVNV